MTEIKSEFLFEKCSPLPGRYCSFGDVRAACKLTHVLQRRHVAESNGINSMTVRVTVFSRDRTGDFGNFTSHRAATVYHL